MLFAEWGGTKKQKKQLFLQMMSQTVVYEKTSEAATNRDVQHKKTHKKLQMQKRFQGNILTSDLQNEFSREFRVFCSRLFSAKYSLS